MIMDKLPKYRLEFQLLRSVALVRVTLIYESDSLADIDAKVELFENNPYVRFGEFMLYDNESRHLLDRLGRDK